MSDTPHSCVLFRERFGLGGTWKRQFGVALTGLSQAQSGERYEQVAVVGSVSNIHPGFLSGIEKAVCRVQAASPEKLAYWKMKISASDKADTKLKALADLKTSHNEGV